MADKPVDAQESLADLEPELLGEIVALMAHDLRNPLAALLSNVGYLSMVGQTLSIEVREALFDLQLSVEALARMSDTLETVSHDLRRVAPALPSSVAVSRLVPSILPAVERAAQSYGVVLSVRLQGERTIRVVEAPFARALTNLLHNAVGLAPHSSEVRLTSYDEVGHLVLRVEDDGVPLDVVSARSAFSARGQLDAKSAASGRYTRGLGLYMVGKNARLAGVEVRVGHAEHGSCIELVAPLAAF